MKKYYDGPYSEEQHNALMPRPLYAYRSVHSEDAEKLIAWAHSQGIKTTLEKYDLHVTVMYSTMPSVWDYRDSKSETLLVRGGARAVSNFGDDGNTIVLEIESPELTARHNELIATGCVPGYKTYRAHVTITAEGQGVDVSQIAPYTGDIRLDREWFQETHIDGYGKSVHMTNHASRPNGYQSYSDAAVVKVDASLGLVFGYAIVSKVDGEDYYDHHNDHIPEESMLKAAMAFMKSDRVGGDMHGRDADGGVVRDGDIIFAFPMTQDIADSLGIVVKQTGLLVALQPSKAVFDKFRSGQYTGFSIGGRRILDEDV